MTLLFQILLLKFRYGSDCRLVDVDRAISYHDFVEVLTNRFGFKPVVQYVDTVGDSVLVDGPVSMEAAFSAVITTGRNVFLVLPSTTVDDAVEFHFALPGFTNDLNQFSVDNEMETGNQRMKPFLLQELGKRCHCAFYSSVFIFLSSQASYFGTWELSALSLSLGLSFPISTSLSTSLSLYRPPAFSQCLLQ